MSVYRRAKTKRRKAFLVTLSHLLMVEFSHSNDVQIPFCLAEPNLIVIQLNPNICCYVSANRRQLLFMAHKRSLGLCLERPKLSQRNILECFIKDQPLLKKFQVLNCNLAIAFEILSALYDKRIFLFNYVRQ